MELFVNVLLYNVIDDYCDARCSRVKHFVTTLDLKESLFYTEQTFFNMPSLFEISLF